MNRPLHEPIKVRYLSWQMLLLLWGGVLCAAFLRGGAAEWLAAAVLGGLIVFALLAPRVSLGQLDIARVVKPAAWNGRERAAVEVELSFSLKQGTIVLPFVWLHIEERLANQSAFAGGPLTYSRLIMPWFRRTWTIRYSTRGLSRGEYGFEAVNVTSGDLFGLFMLNRTVKCESRIVVLPSQPRLKGMGLSLAAGQEEKGNRVIDTGTKYVRRKQPGGGTESRVYHPGDSLRHMDWRSAAKGRDYRIRLNQRQETGDLLIVLDTSAESYQRRNDLFDECAAIALEAIKQNSTMGSRIWLTGGADWYVITPGDRRGIEQAAELLARARMNEADTPGIIVERWLKQLPVRGGELLLVTANWQNKNAWRRAGEQAALAAVRTKLCVAIERNILSAAMRECRRQLEVSGIAVSWAQLEPAAGQKQAERQERRMGNVSKG